VVEGSDVVELLLLLILVPDMVIIALSHIDRVILLALVLVGNFAPLVRVPVAEFDVAVVFAADFIFDLVAHLLFVDEFGLLNFALLGNLHVVEGFHLLLT
jgi:hypothetical protein